MVAFTSSMAQIIGNKLNSKGQCADKSVDSNKKINPVDELPKQPGEKLTNNRKVLNYWHHSTVEKDFLTM